MKTKLTKQQIIPILIAGLGSSMKNAEDLTLSFPKKMNEYYLACLEREMCFLSTGDQNDGYLKMGDRFVGQTFNLYFCRIGNFVVVANNFQKYIVVPDTMQISGVQDNSLQVLTNDEFALYHITGEGPYLFETLHDVDNW